MKAIETVWKGYRFRSRLEARWAVFFSALNLDWEYEPEGYELGSAGRYLPDFWIPELELFCEVKPSNGANAEEMKKVIALHWDTGYPVAVLSGPPGRSLIESRYEAQQLVASETTDSSGGRGIFEFQFVTIEGDTWIKPDAGFRDRWFVNPDWDGSAKRIISTPDHRIDGWDLSYRYVLRAANAARSARFEHGESPA